MISKSLVQDDCDCVVSRPCDGCADPLFCSTSWVLFGSFHYQTFLFDFNIDDEPFGLGLDGTMIEGQDYEGHQISRLSFNQTIIRIIARYKSQRDTPSNVLLLSPYCNIETV